MAMMMKTNRSGDFFTMASRFLRCCLVIVAVGPIDHSSAVHSAVTIIPNCTDANSPVWVNEVNNVVFVSAYEKVMIRYHPGSPDHFSVVLDVHSDLVFVVPVKSNGTKYVVGFGKGIGLFAWDGETRDDEPPLKSENFLSVVESGSFAVEQVNCGKADVAGRLWVGTGYLVEDGPTRGRLYSVSRSGEIIKKLDDIGEPYGIAWSPDNKYLYYSDTNDYTVVSIEFNKDTGDLIGEGKVIFELASQNITPPSMPWGMTVDADGFLWLAIFREVFVLKIDPTNGTVLTRVDIPETSSVTSVVFGIRDLYVTTSNSLVRVTDTGSTGVDGYELDEPQWPPVA